MEVGKRKLKRKAQRKMEQMQRKKAKQEATAAGPPLVVHGEDAGAEGNLGDDQGRVLPPSTPGTAAGSEDGESTSEAKQSKKQKKKERKERREKTKEVFDFAKEGGSLLDMPIRKPADAAAPNLSAANGSGERESVNKKKDGHKKKGNKEEKKASSSAAPRKRNEVGSGNRSMTFKS